MAVWKEMGWDGMDMGLAEKIYARKVLRNSLDKLFHFAVALASLATARQTRPSFAPDLTSNFRFLGLGRQLFSPKCSKTSNFRYGLVWLR
jgi:hypothetical protein